MRLMINNNNNNNILTSLMSLYKIQDTRYFISGTEPIVETYHILCLQITFL